MNHDSTDLDDLIQIVDRLPFVAAIKRDVLNLRKLLYDRRPARIATIGPSASVHPQLANALLHAQAFGPDGLIPHVDSGQWVQVNAAGRKLAWLELSYEAGIEALKTDAQRAFHAQTPDLILLTLKDNTSPERDAALASLKTLQEVLSQPTPILAVWIKCDESTDGNIIDDAPMDAEAHQTLRDALSPDDIGEDDVLIWHADQPETSGPRGIETLCNRIIEVLPEEAKLEAVRALQISQDARRDVARGLVNSCSALAVTVGLAPVPFADAVVLLPLQAAMVTGLAYISGKPWDRRAAGEWIASLGATGGAGLGLRWGAQQLVKFLPGAGTLVGAGVAGAGTLGIGQSAIAYFIDGPGRLETRKELKADIEAPPDAS